MTNTISAILNEKDVENFYRQYLTKKFGDIVFNSPVKCDGYGESKKHGVRLLCEFKDNLDLTLRVNQVKVLSQAVYYIKKFEIAGKILPSVIFVGDRDECFAVHTNDVFKYLSMELDWSIAPSNAHTNLVLVNEMLSDNNLNPFVFNVNDVDQCIDKIKQLTEGVKRLIPITPHNITEVFKHFEEKVLGKHNLTTNQLANLFVQILINPSDNFYHPKKKNVLYTKSHGDIGLKSTQAFISFFSHFASEYSPKQKEHLTAVVDRLVQDVTRRKQGEFFTPTIWVDKAHEYIASVFGEDWKEKYVVWDPAWGTGNLTRDYKFKELYVSTLVYADIETANQMGYNPEAVKFQYDFLNDPYEYLPAGLRKAIESGRQIIVLMNPPYGKPTPNNNLLDENKSTSKGMANTKVGNEMNGEKMGIASSQLYLQFMYRLHKIGVNICMFSTPGFLSQISNKVFRKKFLSEYSLSKGFIMDSSEFADTKSWGLTFSILIKNVNEDKFSFNYDILERNDNFEISKTREKLIYNTDDKETLSEWMEMDLPKNDITFPVFESALGISRHLKKGCSSAIGYINNDSNNVQQQNVIHLMSGVCKANGNKSITTQNFSRMMTGFAARKIVKRFWLDDKDEFIKPNIESEFFGQFKNDSVVYSIFHIHSFQTSLRNSEYNNQIWDIKNQFFWMSKEEMMNLANQNNYTEMYNDARTDSDRYVHNLLFGEQRIYDQLSTEAKDVLDIATELVRLSIGMRRNFADDTNHLNSWDAGYAQLKLLWKEYFPEQFKEFRNKYKALEDKMRPMVYELGFLKQ
jgi:hypothetical protein